MNCPLAYEELPAFKVAAKVTKVDCWDGKTVSEETTSNAADFLFTDTPNDDYMGAA